MDRGGAAGGNSAESLRLESAWARLCVSLDSRLTSQIAEFQSFNFHDKDATQMAIVMALAALGGVLALTQKKLAHFLLAALFFWGGLRSARVLPLVALVILPVANSAIATALRQTARLFASRCSIVWTPVLAYSARLRRIDLRLTRRGFRSCPRALPLCHASLLMHHVGFSRGRIPRGRRAERSRTYPPMPAS